MIISSDVSGGTHYSRGDSAALRDTLQSASCFKQEETKTCQSLSLLTLHFSPALCLFTTSHTLKSHSMTLRLVHRRKDSAAGKRSLQFAPIGHSEAESSASTEPNLSLTRPAGAWERSQQRSWSAAAHNPPQPARRGTCPTLKCLSNEDCRVSRVMT